MTHDMSSTVVEDNNKSMLGFWIYLMTDCILFGALFSTYAVLRNNTYGGESAHHLFSLRFVLIETLLLLTSSFTCGLAMLSAYKANKNQVIKWFAVTFILGLAFLGMELFEFSNLVAEGNSWTRSGFLTAFFTLVGTHGIHIITGLLWLSVLVVRILRSDINSNNIKKLAMFSMFWHFLDIIWIFIFTFVYLFGALSV